MLTASHPASADTVEGMGTRSCFSWSKACPFAGLCPHSARRDHRLPVVSFFQQVCAQLLCKEQLLSGNSLGSLMGKEPLRQGAKGSEREGREGLPRAPCAPEEDTGRRRTPRPQA